MVQVLVHDPEPILYGHEQLYRDGVHVGEANRTAPTGTPSEAGSGWRSSSPRTASADECIDERHAGSSTSWARRYPVTISLQPMYDPARARIKA